jgi:hypothetical protein
MSDDMDLPPGKTCGDCGGWKRCKAFIGSLQPTNTRCDWSPSAFWPAPPAPDASSTVAPAEGNNPEMHAAGGRLPSGASPGTPTQLDRLEQKLDRILEAVVEPEAPDDEDDDPGKDLDGNPNGRARDQNSPL